MDLDVHRDIIHGMYIYNMSILLLHVIHCSVVYIHTYSMLYIIYIKFAVEIKWSLRRLKGWDWFAALSGGFLCCSSAPPCLQKG